MGLLEAIATVESRLNLYVVNVQGIGYQFHTLDQAASFVKQKISAGIKNISVGPMQLHVPSHRRHFGSVEEMLDPVKNITYAGKLLQKLKKTYGSCEDAVRYYHSADPHHNRQYQRRVFGAWAVIKKKQQASDQRCVRQISGRSTAPPAPSTRAHMLMIAHAIHRFSTRNESEKPFFSALPQLTLSAKSLYL